MADEKNPLEGLKKALEILSQELQKTHGYNTVSLEGMKDDMRDILYSLIENKDTFNISRTKTLFESYIKKSKRLLYSEVTVFIFSLNDKLPIFVTNLESVVEDYIKNDINIEKEETKAFIKLWDHVNLANNQMDKLSFTEEKFAEQTRPIIDKIQETTDDLENTKKEILTQLISIVGIFTALAFVGFGGISMLNTVFSMSSRGIMNIVILGSLCGIVIINLIFIFIYFISKMSNTSIKTCGHSGVCNCNVLLKYPFFYIVNAIMIEIFMVSSILYLSRSESEQFLWIARNTWILIIGISTAISLFIIYTIYKCIKNKN